MNLDEFRFEADLCHFAQVLCSPCWVICIMPIERVIEEGYIEKANASHHKILFQGGIFPLKLWLLSAVKNGWEIKD